MKVQGARFRIALIATAVVVLLGALALVWSLRPPTDPRERVRRLWSRLGVGQPNVVVITLDTTRADHLGCYGYAEAETPNLDALARRGVLFSQASTPAPLTLPAHSSIMTGTYPTFHGVRVNGNAALSQSQTTMAESLSQKGYATGAFIAAFVLDGRWGLNQGFDVYDDHFDLKKYKHLDLGTVQRPGNEVMDAALAWLEEHKKAPFFAWIHLYDAHTPYEPPEPFRSRHAGRGMVGLYDGEIAFADSQVGRCVSWLEASGHAKDTTIVILGDHGEALGAHGEASHGYFVYDSTTHVPFLVVTPFAELRGIRVDSQVSSVDVLPTLFALIGVDVPPKVQGRSLLPSMLAPEARTETYAYGESMTPNLQFGWSALHSLRSTRYKLIEAPRPELYDLRTDPGETTNLFDERRGVAHELMRRLDRLMEETSKGAPGPEAADLDKETLEGLAALGYVGGGSLAPKTSDPGAPLADPKDKLEVFKAVQQAGELVANDDRAGATKLLESALREDPRMPQALLMLGGAYSEMGRTAEAKAQFDLVLKDDPQSVQALVGMAGLLMREGKIKDVVALCKKTLSLDDRNMQAYALLGEVYVGQGQPETALPHFEKAVEIQPKMTQNRMNLASCLIELKKYDRAEKVLREIVEENPRFPMAQFSLGLLYQEVGRTREARSAYEAEVAAYPDHFKARFNLGKLLFQLGDRKASIEQMREVMRIAPKQPEGYLFVARSLLAEEGALDEIQPLVEKGLSLAQAPDMKALGWLLMADVFNRRGQPDRMNDALKHADGYVSATKTGSRHATRNP
jgi:arylsulfatase A-like enzyme/tetratricopeptide (TPR) repeat protein